MDSCMATRVQVDRVTPGSVGHVCLSIPCRRIHGKSNDDDDELLCNFDLLKATQPNLSHKRSIVSLF